jgi:hypothetical protein
MEIKPYRENTPTQKVFLSKTRKIEVGIRDQQ